MKKIIIPWLLLLEVTVVIGQQSWIRVNQIGYLKEDVKVAVWISKEKQTPDQFELIDAVTGKVVCHSEMVKDSGGLWGFDASARLNFSTFTVPGTYIIRAHGVQSVPFKIGNDIYAGATEIPLKYMRQQRCGYNPFLEDSCHVHDAISVGDPKGERDGQYFNTTGGWHDAWTTCNMSPRRPMLSIRCCLLTVSTPRLSVTTTMPMVMKVPTISRISWMRRNGDW